MLFRGLHPATIAELCRPRALAEPKHVFISICDHFEPKWGGYVADVTRQLSESKSVRFVGRQAPIEVARRRVADWRQRYPRSVEGLADSTGRVPQHTFFYPQDEYEPELLDPIAELCQAGYGEAEIHLHHDRDTSEHLRETLLEFKETLYARHGLLRKNAGGEITYAFIHGNWALDNSRPDGRWCGVNDELTVLRETGCYADFTMPSAPNQCQTRTVNRIYYAIDAPNRPKSHDRGAPAAAGVAPPADALLLIQGPLALDWGRRKWGLLPRIENGDLGGNRPPDRRRFELWLRAGVSVVGCPDWRFIKLHTHGLQELNADMLLGEPMRRFHRSLADWARESADRRYYYVTAREMADLVHQGEANAVGPEVAVRSQEIGSARA